MRPLMVYLLYMKRLALLFILLFVSLAYASQGYPAHVVGVSNGDTLTVLTAEKKQVKIRLAGIDAPETGQDFGQRAKQAASEMAFGKDVTIRASGQDRYGRTVAEVILPDGRNLGREMVRAGMAWRYVKYAPNDGTLARLEATAKAEKRGLWSQPNPIPPWDWRHGTNLPETKGVVGNRRTHVYHVPYCTGASRISERNRVRFPNAEEALKADYRRAGDCPN
jgi:micrococcal nuclease